MADPSILGPELCPSHPWIFSGAIEKVAGKPGAYRATVFLRPHFQLEELTASIRLVASLPPPAAG